MQTLHGRMNNLIGFPVAVEVDGGLSINGNIVGVYGDYVAAQKGDLTYFIQMKFIKEITKNAKYTFKNIHSEEELNLSEQNDSFNGQLNLFIDKWIGITRSGLDELYGVLSSVSDDYAVFIVKDNIKFVPTSQIISFFEPTLNSESENEDDQDDEKSTSDKNEAAKDEGDTELAIQEKAVESDKNKKKNDDKKNEAKTEKSNRGKKHKHRGSKSHSSGQKTNRSINLFVTQSVSRAHQTSLFNNAD